VGALLLTLGGCARASRALGDSVGEARHAVGELLGSIALRFGPRERDPAYAALRPRLVRAAFCPSRVHGDPSAWTEREGERRVVTFGGGTNGGRYRIGVVPRAGLPRRAASYRGVLRLDRLGDDDYVWRLREELAVGPVTGAQLDAALTELLLGAERAPEGDLGPSLFRELPRTTAALGQVATLEAMRRRREDHAVALELEGRLEPAVLAKSHPRYARFLEKYVLPVELCVVARDDTGGEWWRVEHRDGHFGARLRASGGSLAPRVGTPRRIPRTLVVTTDVVTRTGLFRVGVERLEATVETYVTPRARGFVARFRTPPRWVLPFLIRPLMQSSLRRPFEGDGGRLEGAILEDGGPQTLLMREYQVAVHESWIVRWLGRFVGGAVSAFRGPVEREADLLVAQVLLALRADLLEQGKMMVSKQRMEDVDSAGVERTGRRSPEARHTGRVMEGSS
jgi:hypothetical protein